MNYEEFTVWLQAYLEVEKDENGNISPDAVKTIESKLCFLTADPE